MNKRQNEDDSTPSIEEKISSAIQQYEQKQKRLESGDPPPSTKTEIQPPPATKTSSKERDFFPERMASEWGVMIYGARDQRERFFELLIKHLDDAEVNGITWSYQIRRPSLDKLVGGRAKESQKFLVIEAKAEGSQAPQYDVFVGADKFGKYLAIKKYVYENWESGYQPQEIFKRERTSYFLTVAHEAVVKAKNDLISELQEASPDVKFEAKEFLKEW